MIEPNIHNLVLKIKVEKLQQFAIGQRWLSDTETELGLGVLIDVDERSISILFPKSDETRVYARNNAPLSRIIFNVKDEVRFLLYLFLFFNMAYKNNRRGYYE